MEMHRQICEPGRGLRKRRNQGDFLEEVMLKLRPEGCTGHSSGVNKDRCKGPRWEGAANSPVQSKQSVTLTGRRGPWGQQAQLTQARGFRSRASRQPGLHSPQIPPRPHPPCHCSTPTRGQESGKYKKYPRLWVIQGALWEGRTHLPTPNAGDTGDMGSFPRSGRFPGEGNSNPLQYS